MRDTFICDYCHQEHPISEFRTFDGQNLCVTCRDERTVLCDSCGDRIWSGRDFGDDGIHLCQDCRGDYGYCHQCGHLVHVDRLHYLSDDDDDDGYCESCYYSHSADSVIQSYYYKPEPIFYGEGSRFFGVELELDGGGERNDKASQLLNVANANGLELLYIKHDGSLNDGLELVSHAMTLDFHQSEMPWRPILQEAIHMGYLSHQARTCGLHVHVNRTAFGETWEKQDEVIARILFFVENHWNELLRFSRRTRSQMEQWAARYGRKDDPKAVLDHAKRHEFERYKCVNLTNTQTIEFRMFRGTLKWNTMIATLQMVDRICDVALYLSDQEVQDLTWSDFVASCTQPELVQYLKERRLYVNEPVAVGEEV